MTVKFEVNGHTGEIFITEGAGYTHVSFVIDGSDSVFINNVLNMVRRVLVAGRKHYIRRHPEVLEEQSFEPDSSRLRGCFRLSFCETPGGEEVVI